MNLVSILLGLVKANPGLVANLVATELENIAKDIRENPDKLTSLLSSEHKQS